MWVELWLGIHPLLCPLLRHFARCIISLLDYPLLNFAIFTPSLPLARAQATFDSNPQYLWKRPRQGRVSGIPARYSIIKRSRQVIKENTSSSEKRKNHHRQRARVKCFGIVSSAGDRERGRERERKAHQIISKIWREEIIERGRCPT